MQSLNSVFVQYARGTRVVIAYASPAKSFTDEEFDQPETVVSDRYDYVTTWNQEMRNAFVEPQPGDRITDAENGRTVEVSANGRGYVFRPTTQNGKRLRIHTVRIS